MILFVTLNGEIGYYNITEEGISDLIMLKKTE